MSDELKVLDLETCRWHPVLLRNASTETNEKTVQPATEQTEQTEKEEITGGYWFFYTIRMTCHTSPPDGTTTSNSC